MCGQPVGFRPPCVLQKQHSHTAQAGVVCERAAATGSSIAVTACSAGQRLCMDLTPVTAQALAGVICAWAPGTSSSVAVAACSADMP
jgi:hypothetical protein